MCGVVGLIGTPDAAREAFLGLTTLQHRGQDAAGILTYDHDGYHRVKNLGLIDSVFNRENMQTLTGSMAIGHARYSTVGRGEIFDVQPFLISYPFGIGMAHNGNIVNAEQIKANLKSRSHRHLLTHSDTEVVLNLLADELAKSVGPRAISGSEELFEHLCKALSTVFDEVNGSYSIVSLIADFGLLAFRDPLGIRPLVWGRRPVRRAGEVQSGRSAGEAHMIASESVSASFLGYENLRNIEAGEVVFIDLEGRVFTRKLTQKTKRPCMFEWVYFASPESELDHVPVYGARIELGRKLAGVVQTALKERGLEADLVVPVPETSRIAAISLSEELGIPYRELLIKNRYIKRTFILDSQEKRQVAVNLKLSPVRSEFAGKRVILVDDSIVRGTTSKKIVDLVRRAGAAKVYFVSTCPPIQHPCYYGIDFPDENELIAAKKTPAQIDEALGADAVIYQKQEGLVESIRAASTHADSKKIDPCMACLNGCYPTDVTVGHEFAKTRRQDRLQENAPGARQENRS